VTRVVDKRAFFQKIGYEPHSPGQWEYHTSGARFKVPCCGRRYGKSTMAARDAEPELLVPNRRFWIVGPTYDLGEKEFRVIWNDLIIQQKLGLDKRVKKAYNKKQGEMYIEFPWQTRIEVRSAEHPAGLVGEALDGVIMSEAAKHGRETWERYIRAALADRLGWATFPTTPEGHNWLYDLWQFGRNPRFQPAYESWRFPSWENPHVYPGGRNDPEIKLLEQTTSPEWFMQEIGADFASFVGKIYAEFDELTHVTPVKFKPLRQNYIAFDWGFVNPLAAIEFQVDGFDNVYIWREHYKPYLRLEDHLQILKSREQPDDYHLDCTFGDAADPEAVATVNQYFGPCIALPEAKANWREGVDLVKMFLKTYDSGFVDEYGTPGMVPKLFIDPSCVNTIREFNTYRAVPNLNSGTNEHGARSAAEKQDDHALDALRYGLMHKFKLGAQAHLSDVYSHSDFYEAAQVGGRTLFQMETRF
jgi:hypothetical protein